ncbi:MAG: DnaJ domain-containing protein [Acidobacteriota bacterium]
MDKTYYEILGVSSRATTREIVNAFRELVRKYHPDRFDMPGKKREAEAHLKNITEAFNTLSNPKRREEYDRGQTAQSQDVVKSPQQQAREYLQQGIVRFKAGDFNGAISLMDFVLSQEPGNSQALFYAGMARLRNPKWRARGSEQVEEAIRRDPYRPEYVAEYARFLAAHGQLIRAKKALQDAQALNPADESLPSLLEELGSEGQKGGKFPIFGKKK